MRRDRSKAANRSDFSAPTGSRPRASEEAQRAFVSGLTEDLFALLAKTSPDNPGSALHRDADAHEALKLGSRLFNFLAGWARDHLVGRTINEIPSAPSALGTSREQALRHERPWDDPDLEAQGAAYDFGNPELNQRIMAEFAHETSRLFGARLGWDLSEAFRALSFGEVADLVRPVKSRLKGRAYRLWLLRLNAVQLAAFRHGTGRTKQQAQIEVAAAYHLGNPPDVDGWKTVEKWQSEVPKRLDPHMFLDAIQAAYVHGQWRAELSRRSSLDDGDQEFLQSLNERYGDDALQSAGSQFRQLQPRYRMKR